MAICPACEALNKALSATEPHAALEHTGTDTRFAGHNFAVQRWRCKKCGTNWARDLDKRDEHANWETS